MSVMENKNDYVEITTKAQQCRAIRVELGLTQTQFGELVGVSKNAASDWENGKYEPNEPRWKIIQALPTLKMNPNEELQLTFLQILPLCPKCREIVRNFINNFYKMLRKKL